MGNGHTILGKSTNSTRQGDDVNVRRLFSAHVCIKWSFHASLVSSTDSKHKGQYMQLAGAGLHFGLLDHVAISLLRMARPVTSHGA
jgi:hypothetical protein